MEETTLAGDPAVSLIVPCRNEAQHIEACLCDLLAFEPPSGGFEILVVDGMSEDSTRNIVARIAAEDPRVRLLVNPRRIAVSALNIGIRAARGQIIARIDAHTRYAPDYLRRCVETLDETGADNVGGPALTRAHTYVQRAIAAAYHSRFAIGSSAFHQPNYEGPADSVPYGCYRRSYLLELGLYDEELARNEDDDLNIRLRRAGGNIYQSPHIRSWYTPRSSLKDLFRQYWQYGYWKVRVLQKHGAPMALHPLIPGIFVASLILLALSAPLFSSAGFGLIVLLITYLSSAVVASFLTAARAGWLLLPLLPAVFTSYHLGYGMGFLVGVWDFVACRLLPRRFAHPAQR